MDSKGPVEAGWDLRVDGIMKSGGDIKVGSSIVIGYSLQSAGIIKAGDGYKIFAGVRASEKDKNSQKIIAKEIKSKVGHGLFQPLSEAVTGLEFRLWPK